MQNHDKEEEDNDEESLDPAERRRQRMEAAASRPPIYNTEALHEKLEDISWPSEVLSPTVLTSIRWARQSSRTTIQ